MNNLLSFSWLALSSNFVSFENVFIREREPVFSQFQFASMLVRCVRIRIDLKKKTMLDAYTFRYKMLIKVTIFFSSL